MTFKTKGAILGVAGFGLQLLGFIVDNMAADNEEARVKDEIMKEVEEKYGPGKSSGQLTRVEGSRS